MKLIFAFLLLPLVCFAQEWTEEIHRITFEEYDATLKYWAEQNPGLFTLQKRGESHEGQPVYLVKITDASVPDEKKLKSQ